MQTNQPTIESRENIEQTNESFITRKVSGWIGRMFGCRHKEMGRPFSNDGQTYRACLNCGARRSFSIRRWEMRGDFYYSLPTSKHFRTLNGLAPRQPKAGLSVSQSNRQYA